MSKSLKHIRHRVAYWIYCGHVFLFYPVNYVLMLRYQKRVYPNSVLHIAYMTHLIHNTVKVLREHGMKADYLAIGKSGVTWDHADYHFIPSRWPHVRAIQEFWWFWRVLAKYEVIHTHYTHTLSRNGWELALCKRMGRKVVIHYRGCDIRDRDKNMQLHPEMNICQVCDYNATLCQEDLAKQRRQIAQKYGDLFLVTTPDMKDFVPQAIHFPFFTSLDIPPESP